MLSYNEITSGKIILYNDEPCEVLSSWVFRKQQRKPVNQTKLRGLKSGKTLEITFHQPDKAEEADLETREVTFIYSRNGEYWFMDPKNPRDRFPLGESVIGSRGIYLKENTTVEAIVFEDEIMSLKLPIKMNLTVTEAPPNIKGNTAQGGNKSVTLETGAKVLTPMFIEEGEIITVNTETGEYISRAPQQ